MVISGAASAESLDILQPSRLSYEMVAEVRHYVTFFSDDIINIGVIV